MSYEQILENLNQGDKQIRENAQQQMEQWRRQNPIEFVIVNSACLTKPNISPAGKMMAGILMKNCIKNVNSEKEVADVWNKLDNNQKIQVRNNCLGALAANEPMVRRAAGQCVAILVKKDIPKGEWLECVDILAQNSNHQQLNFKEASILTIGYICEELKNVEISKQISDKFLTAICQRMTNEETEAKIKRIAICALSNAMSFAYQNFDTQVERDYIVNLICECCQNPDEDVRYFALKSLGDVASLYYDKIQNNLQIIGVVTYNCLKQDVEKNATMALEF